VDDLITNKPGGKYEAPSRILDTQNIKFLFLQIQKFFLKASCDSMPIWYCQAKKGYLGLLWPTLHWEEQITQYHFSLCTDISENWNKREWIL
jgi:hypothetical protein